MDDIKQFQSRPPRTSHNRRHRSASAPASTSASASVLAAIFAAGGAAVAAALARFNLSHASQRNCFYVPRMQKDESSPLPSDRVPCPIARSPLLVAAIAPAATFWPFSNFKSPQWSVSAPLLTCVVAVSPEPPLQHPAAPCSTLQFPNDCANRVTHFNCMRFA